MSNPTTNNNERMPLRAGQQQQRRDEPKIWHYEGGSDTTNSKSQHRFVLTFGILIIMLVMVISAMFIMASTPKRGLGIGGNNDNDDYIRREYPNSFSPEQIRYSEMAFKAIHQNLDSHTNKHNNGDNISRLCETTIFILRHCMKSGYVVDENGDQHCSYVGFEFAQYLSTLFGDDKLDRWPSPDRLYALSIKRPNDRVGGLLSSSASFNYRQHETLRPTSIKLGLDINGDYTIGDEDNLAANIFHDISMGQMCGKLILISWRQPDIPALARKLGCGPYEGCPTLYNPGAFDEAWQIKYVHDPPKTLAPERDDVSAERGKGGFSKHPKWTVFGNVVNLNFDPLSFSKKAGDYPPGGSHVGGRWIDFAGDEV
mmetsp:Transcript_15372/g.22452  ORF Transcript_15372/g.22452 Transcript_15372/m.22452 type:complete len:370 (-) Transcript_15372:29-1138(-)